MKIKKFNLNSLKNRDTEIKYLFHCFLFLNLIIINFNVIGQDNSSDKINNAISNEEPYKTISFGEKITFGIVDNSINWTISNSENKIFVNIKGNQINDYIFEKPGIYNISFSENKKHTDECNHPQFNEKMIIEVTPVKMVFDFSKIKFSQKIQKGISCENITLTVPVTIAIIENVPTKFVVSDITFAGIGSEIVGKPINKEITINNGVQNIEYQLSGIATNQAHLMIDFVDYNNQVQSYTLLEIIK
ncbi:hypothetical protein [Flavobacterium sp.]|uniref:hypothetical protein n=1 Tax=Flavobacterium sp. TaxID=239 RepID=UPI00375139F4